MSWLVICVSVILNTNFQIVVCQPNVVGQRFVDNGVEAHLVAHMREEGTFRMDATDDFESFVKAEVREMLGFAQSIYYQQIDIDEFFLLAVVDMVHIGNVGNPLPLVVNKAVTQHRKILVHSADRRNGDVAHAERAAVAYIVQRGFGQSRILMIVKYIMIVVADGRKCFAISVDFHIALLRPVERPDVVDAAHVVAMGVSHKDCIKMLHTVAQHLHPEIRSYVDKDIVAATVGDQRRGAEPLVVAVGRMADRTRTRNHRNALRRPRTEECDMHQFSEICS